MGPARPRIKLAADDRLTVLQKAQALRRSMTREERILWEALRCRRIDGVKFRRQHPLAQFVVDFFAPSHRLAVEVDGPIHKEAVDYDRRRQGFLESQDIAFLRFTNEEITADLNGCVRRIREALACR